MLVYPELTLRKHKLYVDWKSRDQELAPLLREAACQIIGRAGRPARVTAKALSRVLGIPGIKEKWYMQKLPLASQALSEIAETPGACAVRRIWWAAHCYEQERIYPTRWQLQNRAMIRHLAALPEAQAALDAAMHKLAAHLGLETNA